MTTYIEHETALADANVNAPSLPLTSLALTNAFAETLPGLIALWSLPLTALQLWSQGWASMTERDAPLAASEVDEAQLPMPAPARNSFA